MPNAYYRPEADGMKPFRIFILTMPNIELPAIFRHTKQLHIQYGVTALFLLALLIPAVENLIRSSFAWYSAALLFYIFLCSLPLYIFLVEVFYRRPKCVCSETGFSFRTIWGYTIEISWGDIRSWCFRCKGRGTGASHLEVKLNAKNGQSKKHLFFFGSLSPDLEVLREILKVKAPK